MLTKLNNVKTNFNNIHKSDFIQYITAHIMMIANSTGIKQILYASEVSTYWTLLFFWMHIICFLWR